MRNSLFCSSANWTAEDKQLYSVSAFLWSSVLRGDRISQTGCFFGKLPKGGEGVISDPKNYIADFFGFKTVYFGRKFWKKCPKRGGGGSSPIQKISLQIYAS